MKNYFKILVTTNFSEEAEKAVRYALQFAKGTDSVLIFLHVFQQSPDLPSEFIELEKKDETPIEFELSKLEEYVRAILQAEKLQPSDIKYTCKITKGNTTEEILGIADEEKVDFILLGTHEAGTLQKTLFSSHTWDAIRKTNVPVLAIPSKAKYTKVQNIVYGTEYRQSEIQIIKFLTGFALWFDAELTILHITNNIFSKEFEKDLFEKFKTQVQDEVKYDKLSIRLINGKDLTESLNDFCERSNAAWLVMSHKKTSLLVKLINPTSVAKKMSYQTHIPLFIIPDNYKPSGAAKEISEEELRTHGADANR